MEKTTKQLALVTGASAGVGKEIADILAAKGFDLILAARSEDKLNTIKSELSEKYGVQIKVCPVDLGTENGPLHLYNFCKRSKLTVDLLINNAGCGLFGEAIELGEKAIPMLKLNIESLTLLCSYFGKDMAERKSGSILNIGSIAGNQPTSYFASYAASKSYVLNYSIALRHELGRYKVNVTCVQPGYIRTNFDNACGIKSEKYKKFSHNNGMTPRAVAECAVKSVLAKRSYVRAGFVNKLAAFVTGLIPKNFLAWCMANTVRSMTKDQNSAEQTVKNETKIADTPKVESKPVEEKATVSKAKTSAASTKSTAAKTSTAKKSTAAKTTAPKAESTKKTATTAKKTTTSKTTAGTKSTASKTTNKKSTTTKTTTKKSTK